MQEDSVPEGSEAGAGKGPEAPRCGAHARGGGGCEAPPEPGKRRCRNHGGAPGTGAPRGNRNAFKHGVYSAAELAQRKAIMDFVRRCNGTLAQLEEADRADRLQRLELKAAQRSSST